MNLATNVNAIYSILLGFCDLLKRNMNAASVQGYYNQQQNFKHVVQVNTQPDNFLQNNRDVGINKYKSVGDITIMIREFAPGVFRKIRQNYISEDELFDSFKPANNFNSVHNF